MKMTTIVKKAFFFKFDKLLSSNVKDLSTRGKYIKTGLRPRCSLIWNVYFFVFLSSPDSVHLQNISIHVHVLMIVMSYMTVSFGNDEFEFETAATAWIYQASFSSLIHNVTFFNSI